uniref:Uncharacterized protein n=1 Tax=Glossina palpalis gambiensis TaxID=67801 RepID=A0A1B0BEC3_9MUSC
MTAFQLNLMLNNFDIFTDGEILIGLIGGYNVSITNSISNRFALSDKTSYYISSGTVCYGVWLNWCGCPMQLYKKKKKIWVLWLILIPYVLLRYAMPCHAMPCHAMSVMLPLCILEIEYKNETNSSSDTFNIEQKNN